MQTQVKKPVFENDYTLPGNSMQAFRHDGHVLLRDVLDEESIKAVAASVRDAVRVHNTEGRKI